MVADSLRTQLWPIPALSVAAAVATAVWLTQLDASVDDQLPPGVADFLFGGSADAARSVLAAIAGSLITVTSLTFSLTVVSLQLASSQFSPRLLRTFTRDRVVHTTLALFLATFVYALTVLRTVRTDSPDQAAFVPRIAVTLAYLLAVASVLGLVLFLAHLAREIRVETMLRKVQAEALDTVRRTLDDDQATERAAPPTPAPGARPVALLAPRSGFLTAVDEQQLLDAADRTGATMVVDRAAGDSVVAGTPVAFAWPAEHNGDGSSALGSDATRDLQMVLAKALTIEFERTATQDLGYGLQQLSDVATKALSPGINDPTTAVHALSHMSALLCELTTREIGPRALRDRNHRVRVGLQGRDFGELLGLALSRPRRYGAGEPDVLARMFDLLREVAWRSGDTDNRDAVRAELRRLATVAEAQGFDSSERSRLRRLQGQVEEALSRRWPPATGRHS